ncbi:ATP-binding cassette domain-containing protein [Dactylosporangium sp. AC04546]|uniref:ATP-binding cassette domain-containing protein n=1 Tax=Dactylosporangium sp. AC04546 TaxID=2862460 RepID=UPI001EDE1A3D|nr:ATP-binding cassette domain-containing protein [Dactylosporangium sp. AC04546]WVK78885.1 ATP-binding cassette domain-containing protein [Dactylosporangium sp. AC04546]
MTTNTTSASTTAPGASGTAAATATNGAPADQGTSAASVLRLDGVSRQFGGLTALHDLTLDLPAGARHAVIGPNGAGKSTLLNLVAGTLTPSTGAILINDRDVTHLRPSSRARHGVARTFQHPALFGRLTVHANLELATTSHPRSTSDRTANDTATSRADVAARLADNFGLAAHTTTPAGQLPYGSQRRLELAMAIAGRPNLLLLDEPSAGLDPHEIRHLTTVLTSLPAETALLLVDHHLDLIWAVAQTVTVLHHGRHLATGTPQHIRADPAVRDAYLNPTSPTTTSGPQPSEHHRASRRTAQPGSASALLRVRQLRAGYHGAAVLDSVDLDVHDGEAVAVLGRNGAGKSTLLNTIAGLLAPQPPTRIDWADRPLTARRPHDLARAGIALVPQGRRVFPGLTVREHLSGATNPRRTDTGTRPAWTVERVVDLLPALGERMHHPAQRLSGGEQQMLVLARALLTQPRLLILDEPTEGLAPAVIDQLTTTLSNLVSDGLAVLLAEQRLPTATALADRLVVLDHGRIAMASATCDLTDDEPRQRLHTLLGVAAPVAPPTADHTPGTNTACPDPAGPGPAAAAPSSGDAPQDQP